MTIKVRDKVRKVDFSEAPPGECFYANKTVYLKFKTDCYSPSANAVRCSDGYPAYFFSSDKVVLLDAKLEVCGCR